MLRRAHLPSEILRTIGHFVGDSKAFFSYVELLLELGHLDETLSFLRTLGHSSLQEYLWPCLDLHAFANPTVLDTLFHEYPSSTVSCNMRSAGLVNATVPSAIPTMKLVVRAPPRPEGRDHAETSAACTSILDNCNPPGPHQVVPALPRLECLPRIGMFFDGFGNSDVQRLLRVAIASEGEHFQRLSFSGKHRLDSTTVGLLAQWLNTRQATALAFEDSLALDGDTAAMAQFYDALGRSTTLKSLTWSDCSASQHIALLVIPASVTSLSLTDISNQGGVTTVFPSLSAFLRRSELEELRISLKNWERSWPTPVQLTDLFHRLRLRDAREAELQESPTTVGTRPPPTATSAVSTVRSSNQPIDDTVATFFDALGRCTTLKTLKMVRMSSFVQSAFVLPPNLTSLTMPWIVNKALSAAVIQRLCECLPQSNIVNLNMHGCCVASTDVIALATALAAHPTLQTFVLGNSDLRDGVCSSLAALATTTSLRMLSLHGNAISDIGALEFVCAVEHSTSLRQLRLPTNAITEVGIKALALAAGRRQRQGRPAVQLALQYNVRSVAEAHALQACVVNQGIENVLVVDSR